MTTTASNINNNSDVKPRSKKDTKPSDPKNDNTNKLFIGTTKNLEVVIDGKKKNLGVQMEAFEQGLQKYAGLTWGGKIKQTERTLGLVDIDDFIPTLDPKWYTNFNLDDLDKDGIPKSSSSKIIENSIKKAFLEKALDHTYTSWSRLHWEHGDTVLGYRRKP